VLGSKTAFGAVWSVLSRLSARLIDVVTLLVLARALTPADFGLVAIAATIVAILEVIFEVPLMQALTRLQTVEQAHLDTAFTLAAARGLALSILLAAAAVPVSWIYSDSRLIPVILVLAVTPLARSLYSPKMSDYYRNLSFRQAFISDVSGKVVGAILALIFVFLGFGYWAIVANNVLTLIFSTMMSYIFAPYRPGLSVKKFSTFSQFLGWFSAGQVLAAINWQLDRILLGGFLDKAVFGQFAMSSDLSVLPTQAVIGPGMQPVMAAFSKITADADRLRGAFLKAARLSMLLALPACIGISLAADLIVAVLLGPKWNDAAFFLRCLAPPVALTAYFQVVYSLSVAIDRFSIVVRLNFIDLCLRLMSVVSALMLFGVNGVLVARAFVSIVTFGLTIRSAKSVLSLSVRRQLGNLWQPAAASAAMVVAVLAFRKWSDLSHLASPVQLAMVVGVGATTYAAVLHAVGVRLSAFVKFRAIVPAAE
jgi:O-antigen/teichoic acid export membrane protein